MTSYNTAVIGAGISGLAIARLLKERGVRCTVFEQNKTIGGLIRCEDINGFLYHKVGGHVFNTKSPAVNEWFWSLFDRDQEFYSIARNAKILFNEKFYSYPIENYIYDLPQEIAQAAIKEIIELCGDTSAGNFTNLQDYFLQTFGSTLYKSYFEPYNKKIWQTNLANIPLTWLEGKLPMPSPIEILQYNVFRVAEKMMVHSTFYYPKKGGSQFVATRLAAGLDIRLNCSELRATRNNVRNCWEISGEQFDHIIYTGDVRRLNKFTPDIPTLDDGISSLRTRGITNVLCECDYTDVSWLYVPDQNLECNRIIYTGGFSINNSPSGKHSCVVEFPFGVTSEIIKDNIAKLPGNLRIIAQHDARDAYVIHDKNTTDRINNLKTELKKSNFHLLGRFAEWQYYNIDAAICAAMDLSNSMFTRS